MFEWSQKASIARRRANELAIPWRLRASAPHPRALEVAKASTGAAEPEGAKNVDQAS